MTIQLKIYVSTKASFQVYTNYNS